jgi:hypothetical protein
MKNPLISNEDNKPFILVKLMNNIKDKNYLHKKTKRSEKKIFNKISKNNSFHKQHIKNNSSPKELNENQHQTKIYNYFENRNLNIISHPKSNINYLQSINIHDINNGQYTIYETNKSKKTNQNKIQKKSNPFFEFSKILQEKKIKDKYDILKSKGIFTEQEISQIQSITKEFKSLVKDLSIQENDSLIKIINYFLNKGFKEQIRFIIFKSLINYGIPNTEDFNTFYNIISNKLIKKNLAIPDKMYILLYIEYITNIIKDDSYINSLAKNKLITQFLFNGDNLSNVKSNFAFINAIKKNEKDIESFLQIYLNNNFDKIFNSAILKLNKNYPKAKDVICKILFNIVTQCDKKGYLNYKKIIGDNDAIFDGLKIIGKITQNNNNNNNYIQMISIKLFGVELSEEKFRHAIQDYFLLLVSNFKN